MGSESTSNFEVRKSKSRKRTRRKGKPTESQINSNIKVLKNNADETGEIYKNDILQNEEEALQKYESNDDTLGIEEKAIKNNHKSTTVKTITDNQNNSELTTLGRSSRKRKCGNTSSAESSQDIKIKTNLDFTEDSVGNSKKTSKRQLKREKAEQRELEKKQASKLEATRVALNYVSKWKHARSEWKFEKLKQIWLMDHLLDENSIPDSIFPIVLEYFEGCKGMAREQLLKKGMDVVRTAEEQEEKREEIVQSVAYKRARQLLQALPTET